MNKENLQRMADHIRTVPQEMFDMSVYRQGDHNSIECGSVGCVIGHCIHLAPQLIRKSYGNVDFTSWSERYTEIDCSSDEWLFCFCGEWVNVDNTPEGAALRIEWLINNGLPGDWEDQMYGNTPLCYK